jgi:serine 3-dehydrogenase
MKVLITGASSGIGRATALLLARKGHQVFMTARRKDKLEEIAETSPTVVGEFWVDRLDVSNRQDVARFVDEHTAWLSDIDVLVNNAGLALGLNPFHESPEEDHVRMFETNVLGLLSLTQKIIPFMKARKSGHILNLGSVAAHTPYKGGTVYCATKAAVHMITDALRMDLGGTGIRVSTIAPGRVAETEFSEVRFRGDKELARTVYEAYRVMTAEDVAQNIAWILEQPAHINIQELVILPTDQSSATTLDPLK